MIQISGVQPPPLVGDEVVLTQNGRESTTTGQIAALASPKPYYGNVATHCSMANGLTNNGGSTTSMNTRSLHIACDNMSVFKIWVPNWYADYTGEYASTSPATVTMGIEYPVGVVVQATCMGQAVGVIPGGDTVSFDARVNIPKGALFFVRMHWNSPAGVVFVVISNNSGTIDGMALGGNSLSDLSLSGTISIAGNIYFCPIAITQMTTVPSALLIGDSRCLGQNDVTNGPLCDLGVLARGIGKGGIPYIQQGVPTDEAGNVYTRRAAQQQWCSHVICEYGINNLAFGQNAAQTLAALANTYSYFPTKPVFQTTLSPLTTSSDSWLTVDNQTVASWEAQRLSINASLRTGAVPTIAGVIDTALYVETGTDGGHNIVPNGGFWMADGTVAGKYTTDGIHESQIAAINIGANFPFNEIRR